MKIKSLVDLRLLTERDIDEMKYTVKDVKTKSEGGDPSSSDYRVLSVEFQERKYLKLFLKWVEYLVVQRRDRKMGPGDWEALTNDDFMLHIEKYPAGAPSLTSSSSKSGGIHLPLRSPPIG